MDIHIWGFIFMKQPELLFSLLGIIFVTLLYAFFSASELAFLSADREQLRKDAEEGNLRARSRLDMLDEQQHFLNRIAVCKLSLGLFLAWSLFSLTDATIKFAVQPDPFILLALKLVLTWLMTVFLAAFAGVLPRRLAHRKADRFAGQFWFLLELLLLLFTPLTVPANWLSRLLLKLFGIDPDENTRLVTEQEIRELIDEESARVQIPTEEQTMLQNVFDFGDKIVSEAMTHRLDVTAIEAEAGLDEVLALCREDKFTRMPVYEGNIDHVVGMLHSRDVFLLASSNERENFNIRSLMRDAFFIPEAAKLSSLFREMQKNHVHLAVVIDEYGGMAGIITVEDLLEEIVGNIQDEYDEETPNIQKSGENSWMVEGWVSPEDVAEAIAIELPAEDNDTIAGFVLNLLDRIPEPDEKAMVNYENLQFTVEAMTDKRIDLLKIEIVPEIPAEVIDEKEILMNG